MNISEVWMRLEALAHLRGLPHLKNLRAKIEAEIAEIEADLAPPEPVAPKAIPSEPEEDPEAPSVERRA